MELLIVAIVAPGCISPFTPLGYVAIPPSPLPNLLLFTPYVFAHVPHRSGQINKVYGREMYTALVGSPGQAVVYVFEYNADTEEWDEVQV